MLRNIEKETFKVLNEICFSYSKSVLISLVVLLEHRKRKLERLEIKYLFSLSKCFNKPSCASEHRKRDLERLEI